MSNSKKEKVNEIREITAILKELSAQGLAIVKASADVLRASEMMHREGS